MVSFKAILSRLDTSALTEILGRPAVRLLRALDEQNANPTRLREFVLAQCSPQSLLLNASSRELILEVLSRSEAIEFCSHLNLSIKEDPFSRLKQAFAKPSPSRQQMLMSFFGLAAPLEEDEPRKPEAVQLTPQYMLFPHQRSALLRLNTALERHPHRAVLHMPTGAGKTRTMMNFIAEHLRHREPTVVFWLASSEELCEQAAGEFEQAWRTLGNRTITLQRAWGGRELEPKALNDGLVVASLATIYARQMKIGTWVAWAGDKTSLVVLDEAHQAIAPTYRFVIEALLSRRLDSALVGLTATPGRTWDDVAEDQKLAEFFGGNKVTLTVKGYSNPVEYLIHEGYLAQPHFSRIEIASEYKGFVTREQLSHELEIPESILNVLADDEVRTIKIIRSIEELAKRHRRILVFATTVGHSEILATVLQSMGISSRSVTSRTSATDRGTAIGWYRQRSEDVRVLTNYGVLTTGFDAPQTSAAVIARPTKSLVLFSQMVGRATRGPRAGGNAKAEIVTVVDTSLPGFGDMSKAFENWEDVWE